MGKTVYMYLIQIRTKGKEGWGRERGEGGEGGRRKEGEWKEWRGLRLSKRWSLENLSLIVEHVCEMQPSSLCLAR